MLGVVVRLQRIPSEYAGFFKEAVISERVAALVSLQLTPRGRPVAVRQSKPHAADSDSTQPLSDPPHLGHPSLESPLMHKFWTAGE